MQNNDPFKAERRRRTAPFLALITLGFCVYLYWWTGHTQVVDLRGLDWSAIVGFLALVAIGYFGGALRAIVSPPLLILLTIAWIAILPDGAWLGLPVLVWEADPDRKDQFNHLIFGVGAAVMSGGIATLALRDLNQWTGIDPTAGLALGLFGLLWGASFFLAGLPFPAMAVISVTAFLFRTVTGAGLVALVLLAAASAISFLRRQRRGGANGDFFDDDFGNGSARPAQPWEIPGLQ